MGSNPDWATNINKERQNMKTTKQENIQRQEFIQNIMLADKEQETKKITITTTTLVKIPKKQNIFNNYNIYKKSTYLTKIGLIWSDIKTSVPKQDNDNTTQDEKPKGRTWGILLNKYIVSHKDCYYLQTFTPSDELNTIETKYYKKDISDNNSQLIELTNDEIQIVKHYSKPLNKQDVIIRDINFDNINAIVMNDIEYILNDTKTLNI